MTPLSEGEAAILGRLADIAQQQATTAQQQAVNTERMTGIISQMAEHLRRADDDREIAVAGLREHITTTVAAGDGQLRKLAIVMCIIVAVAEFLRTGLGWLAPILRLPH